jgi:hypothetical protein
MTTSKVAAVLEDMAPVSHGAIRRSMHTPEAATALPCVLDIEASGFGRASCPIEVGWVLPDGRARCTLVRPAAHWTHWDLAAERVHGIARAALLAHGRAVSEVAHRLNDELGGHAVYCDGWAQPGPGDAQPPRSFSCSSRHITLPEPLLGRLSANSTMRGTL